MIKQRTKAVCNMIFEGKANIVRYVYSAILLMACSVSFAECNEKADKMFLKQLSGKMGSSVGYLYATEYSGNKFTLWMNMEWDVSDFNSADINKDILRLQKVFCWILNQLI